MKPVSCQTETQNQQRWSNLSFLHDQKYADTWRFQPHVIVELVIPKPRAFICFCNSLHSSGSRFSTRCWTCCRICSCSATRALARSNTDVGGSSLTHSWRLSPKCWQKVGRTSEISLYAVGLRFPFIINKEPGKTAREGCPHTFGHVGYIYLYSVSRVIFHILVIVNKSNTNNKTNNECIYWQVLCVQPKLGWLIIF